MREAGGKSSIALTENSASPWGRSCRIWNASACVSPLREGAIATSSQSSERPVRAWGRTMAATRVQASRGGPRGPSTWQRPLVSVHRAGRRPGAQGPRRKGGPGCPWEQTPLLYLVAVIPLTSSVSTTQRVVLFKRTGCVNARFSFLGTQCQRQSCVCLPLCPRALFSLCLCVSLCFPPFPPPSILL